MAVSSPFGSQTRTRLLIAFELLRQSYARELARLLEAPLSVVQKGLASLERDGLIAGRLLGRTPPLRNHPALLRREGAAGSPRQTRGSRRRSQEACRRAEAPASAHREAPVKITRSEERRVGKECRS